jgi:hypothetical protein
MTSLITREIIEAYLSCKFKASLKLAGEEGSPSDYDSLLAEVRIRSASAFEKQARSTAEPSGILSDVALSLSSLRVGASFLFRACCRTDDRFISIDALKRVRGDSRLVQDLKDGLYYAYLKRRLDKHS